MTRLEIFDPAMCCSTGVCGPDVDPQLVKFSADLDWVQKQGVDVSRFNISQEPGAFVENEIVKTALAEDGNDVLPLVLIDGRVMCRGFYPERSQLQSMLKIKDVAETAEKESSGGCCGPSDEDSSSSSSCC